MKISPFNFQNKQSHRLNNNLIIRYTIQVKAMLLLRYLPQHRLKSSNKLLLKVPSYGCKVI